MKTYSIYNGRNGLLTGRQIACTEEVLAMNLQPGEGAVEGAYSHKRYKVNPLTKKVEDFQPPSPSANHAWDDEKKDWVYQPTAEDKARAIRVERDARMSACDWVTLRAMRLHQPVPVDWRVYQQALADITDQPGFPETINWPTPPEGSKV